MSKNLKTTIIAALVAVCAPPIFGASVTFNGATIEYSGATVTYPDGEGGDIVFKFTGTSPDSGSLKLPSYAKAWILSVGGGGAGGSATEDYSAGAGGGGGAGGFVEKSNVILSGGTYKITVGEGGTPAAAETAASGGDGKASYIKFNGEEISDYTAQGGGGGGFIGSAMSQAGGNMIRKMGGKIPGLGKMFGGE